MFLIGLFLALAVGARPTSIILAIFVFTAILISDIKKYSYFFLPLIIYGTILAAYNYLRFDSIFDFGFKYQFSPNYLITISKNFSFIIQHFLYNLFYFPKFITINPYVIFHNASINNFEPLIGGLMVTPIIISLIGLLNFKRK